MSEKKKQESIIEGLLIAMEQAQTDKDIERINDAISCINSLTTIADQADARIAKLEKERPHGDSVVIQANGWPGYLIAGDSAVDFTSQLLEIDVSGLSRNGRARFAGILLYGECIAGCILHLGEKIQKQLRTKRETILAEGKEAAK